MSERRREVFPGTEERVVRKVIITAAITGAAHIPTMSDYLPITPKQIADDAVGARKAGAAIVHIHARNPENGEPTPDLNIFRQILTDIKKRAPDLVVCITTGGAGDVKQRIAPIPEFKPELATLNCGSLSMGTGEPRGTLKRSFKYAWEEVRSTRDDNVWPNTFKMMKDYSTIDKENGTKPECEIWDTGQINAGYLTKPVHLQFVMGSLSGIAATPEALIFGLNQVHRLIGNEFTWSACVAGRDQFAMAAVSLVLGGHVRVGLEDNLYNGAGVMAKSSGEQVERIVKIARELSIAPATPDDARKILGLKGADKVNF
jgi:uncharacterized protein (DUF849 family)